MGNYSYSRSNFFSNIILLLLLLFSVSLQGQEKATNHLLNYKTEKDSAYYADYHKLSALYLRYLDSPSLKYASFIGRAYSEKYEKEFDGMPSDKKNGCLGWIKSNIHKTKFKSYEDAQKEYNSILKAYRDSLEAPDNKEYNELFSASLLKYGPNMFADIVKETVKTHPNKYSGY